MIRFFRHSIKNLCSPKAIPPLARNRGFTIFELVVVIMVVAILAAATGPMVSQWNSNKQLSGTARTLFADLQLAKLQAIRNNCNVVASFTANDYEVFLDNGGPTEADGPGNDIRNTTETMVATATMPGDVVILIPGGDFDSTTTPGFTSRALPLDNRTGSVVVRRAGLTERWYRVRLTASGQLKFEKSTDSTDGSDGTWK